MHICTPWYRRVNHADAPCLPINSAVLRLTLKQGEECGDATTVRPIREEQTQSQVPLLPYSTRIQHPVTGFMASPVQFQLNQFNPSRGRSSLVWLFQNIPHFVLKHLFFLQKSHKFNTVITRWCKLDSCKMRKFASVHMQHVRKGKKSPVKWLTSTLSHSVQ